MTTNHYDVIIIGGRCAGSSLTLWLADQKLKILLIDRATFPSLPNVPSSPFIYPCTLRLMDELGFKESDYTLPGSKIERFIIEFVNYFHAEMPTSRMLLDRNYCYGLDRNVFDYALWQRATSVAGVTAYEGFSVTEITKDAAGNVQGIVGKTVDGKTEQYTADLVVGADGRFSFAARQLGAKIVEERNDHTTATYHAEWENVEDYSPQSPNAVSLYNTNQNFAVLVIPIATRKYIISTYMKSEAAHFGAQGVEKAYEEGLKRAPQLMKRLQNAKRVTDVVGVRPIENGYREAYGANWALVGDAVHYKDPFDGQGIYDALLETKILAQCIVEWKQRGLSWTDAGAKYQQQMMDATHPMFVQTVKRVQQAIYTKVPGFALKTIVRWVLHDPDYQTEYLQYLSRAIPPADYRIEPPISPKIIMNGMMGDLRHWFKRQSTSN